MGSASKFAEEMDTLTEEIIGCSFQVSNTLGAGFVEKIYENALAHELRKRAMEVQQQFPVQVKYDGALVGEFFCDLLVNKSVVVELKAVKILEPVHMAQCLNYLKATGFKVCLLMNFGRKKLEFRRIVNHF
jgi:GxxExxY protein